MGPGRGGLGVHPSTDHPPSICLHSKAGRLRYNRTLDESPPPGADRGFEDEGGGASKTDPV